MSAGSFVVDVAARIETKIRNRPKAVARRAAKAARKAQRQRPVDETAEDFNQPNEAEVSMLQALKSKTVWFGIATGVWGIVQVFIAAGDFSAEAIVSLVSGVVIIVLRAVTDKPLSAK